MAIDFPTDVTDTEPTTLLGVKAGTPNIPSKAAVGQTGRAVMAATDVAAGRGALEIESTLLSGAADPAGTDGQNGDFWLRTDTNVLFGPKAAGAWPTPGTSLVGPAGADGSDGAPGAPGADGSDGAPGADGSNGADGKTVLNGTVDPTTEGADGDFYLRTDTSTLFGPKATTWPAGVSLIGPAGADGSDGTNGTNGTDGDDGKTILNGTADPQSTDGVDGDFWLNTTSYEFFGPKAAGAWPGSGVKLATLGYQLPSVGSSSLYSDPGTIDDFDIGSNGVITFIAGAGEKLLSGFANPATGRVLYIYTTNTSLTLKHQSADSSELNRIVTPGGTDLVVSVDSGCVLIYISNRWRVIATV